MNEMAARDFGSVRDALLQAIPDTEAGLRDELADLSAPTWDTLVAPEVHAQKVHRATWLAQHEIIGRYLPKDEADCTPWQEEVVMILRGEK